MQILSTLISADGGQARVAGHDVSAEPDAVRAAIGVTGQFSAVDHLLTGEENMRLMADLHHLGRRDGWRRVAALLDRFDLTADARKQAAAYSGGMRRRLDLAMTLVGDPRLIFLDEPTTGLDPRSRRTMWQIIRDLAAAGVTIFLTTQYLEEADQLAGRIAVLDYGVIVAQGSAAELKRRVPGGHVRLHFARARDLDAAARTVGAAARDDEALTLQVSGDGDARSVRDLLNQLDRASVGVDRLSIHTPDLDDVFLALTGHSPAVQPAGSQQPGGAAGRPTGRPRTESQLAMTIVLSYTVADSATMLRRQLRHIRRYPSLTLMLVGLPIILLLLFVYVFGGTLGAGLGGVSGGRAAYANYVAPGIILLAVAAAAQGTAISVAVDMTEGIIARFRTMAIARASVLTGHVLGSLIQTMLSLAVVVAVAVGVGFRPTAGPLAWLAAVGVLAMTAFALIWLCVALGLAAKSVETASNSPMFLMLLPFLSSGFVPTQSMPAGLRWFAEYQPFTPITETVRHLLLGGPVAHDAIVAAAWCAGIALFGYLWAKKLYARQP